MTPSLPVRGEVWLVDLDPTRGREQRGTRPALVVSADRFSQGPAELVIVLPLTKVSKGIPSHGPWLGRTLGSTTYSVISCEQVRCVSRERLARRIGRAPADAMARVGVVLRTLLEL